MISKAGDLSWIEHLGEIRKCLIRIVVVLVSCMGIGFFLTGHVLRLLLATQLPTGVGLNAFSPFDSLQLYMRFSLAIGLVIAISFILYQIWCFAKPGLRDEERKAALAYIPLAVSLFLTGLAFGYFILLRMVLTFSINLSKGLEIGMLFGVNQYFAFMLNILLSIGLIFELPVVVLFLTSIRLLNPRRLKKMRRYAYIVLVVLSAIVSPPDLLSPLIVMIPLFLLFEASVLLSNWMYRKKENRSTS